MVSDNFPRDPFGRGIHRLNRAVLVLIVVIRLTDAQNMHPLLKHPGPVSLAPAPVHLTIQLDCKIVSHVPGVTGP